MKSESSPCETRKAIPYTPQTSDFTAKCAILQWIVKEPIIVSELLMAQNVKHCNKTNGALLCHNITLITFSLIISWIIDMKDA